MKVWQTALNMEGDLLRRCRFRYPKERALNGNCDLNLNSGTYYMTSNSNIRAIIWDYDGTLVDSRHKNLNVTQKIIERICSKNGEQFTALGSLEAYHATNRHHPNWREMYRCEFNLNEDQIDAAGIMWTEYQLKDDTPVPFYDGVEDVIRAMGEFPHGIVSQNSKYSIMRVLAQKELLPYFDHIVGYEEVGLKRQKPKPDGLLMCLEKLSPSATGIVLYIGDHETDAQCAFQANRVLAKDRVALKVISIGALFDSETDTSNWCIRPDYEIQRAAELLDIVNHLRETPR